MFTLDLARAHIRELTRAAERSHRSTLLPDSPSLLSRLSRRAQRGR